MKYTVYQVTNQINGKIYIGKHQTENPVDGYFGSGKAIKEAITKYGKKNFTKEVLYIFDNEDEMNLKEKELINEEFVKRRDTYNLGVGGEGGPHFKGRTHSKESIEKMKRFGDHLTENGRKRIIQSNSKRIISDETKKKLSEKAKQRTHSEETKKKIADAIKRKNMARRRSGNSLDS
jgi:group I intron endonuclease|tara:strand:- start:60 stop:590 length:531 start_codon:yes stop_codon:yes gene_type:complete